jgi:muramoyltetrapeptide carboxypeptidase
MEPQKPGMTPASPAVTPPYLRQGDRIAIVSPARSISFEEVFPTIRLLESWGLEVILGTHMFGKHHQFSGTDDQRLHDLQQFLDDPGISAILCARGGYGTVRIIDRIDFAGFAEQPKWIVGYSDITVLHAHIHRHFNIETLHAVMPVNITASTPTDSLETLRNALFGSRIRYHFPAAGQSRSGEGEGQLVGGNLSILYSLMGSGSEIGTAGKILFLEDVDEYLYHVDRMMMSLKRSGKLDRLAGLIVGGMDRMNDNDIAFGQTAAEIIATAVKEYKYPVCFNFPAGHGEKNLALILGRKIRLLVNQKVEIAF